MLTLLIADTSEIICGEMSTYCSGLSDIRLVKCVHNGLDALEVINSEHVDVLLMDTIMPVLDGIGLLTEFDGLAHKPSVFVYTAFPNDKLLIELQRLGCEYCFVKPMSPETIIQRIFQLTAKRREGKTPIPAAKISSESAPSPRNDIIEEITLQIRAVGMPAHLTGYHYLREAIYFSVVSEDPCKIAVTKDIYPYIAGIYEKRPQLIERSIRTAIEIAWIRGNVKTLNEYFGYTIDDNKGKPTNAEFIAMIADRVRMKIK